MSEENADVVRKSYEAWNRGDMKAVGECYAPDAVLYPREDFTDSQIRRGRAEILSLFAELRGFMERDEFELEEIVEAGDFVVVAVMWSALITGTEDEVEMPLGLTFTFREGQITEVRVYRTLPEALEAAGLRE
jgi:ketosteroid isomerase-like protein